MIIKKEKNLLAVHVRLIPFADVGIFCRLSWSRVSDYFTLGIEDMMIVDKGTER